MNFLYEKTDVIYNVLSSMGTLSREAATCISVRVNCKRGCKFFPLILLHSERPKLYIILAFLSAIGLRVDLGFQELSSQKKYKRSHKSCSFCQYGGKAWK